MKNLFYFFVLMCSSATMFAQDFAIVYEPQNADDYVAIRDVYKTSDGNILAGYDFMSAGVPAAGIMKTDNDGFVLWSKTLEIPASLAGCTFEVIENAEGNFYLWGLSKEEETLNMRAILSEISADGEMLWSKEYDFGFNLTTSYTVNKMMLLPSGDLQMMIAVYDEVIVMKTNAEGEILWGKSSAMGPPDEGGKNPGFEWLAIPDDGGMCASKAENDFSLLRYSEDGDIMWNQTYHIGGYTHGKSIARSPNGNILIAGFIDFVPHIMEISDEDGSINWIKTFEGLSMTFLGKSHLAVIGEEIILDMTTNGGGTNEQYILKMSEEGEVLEAMKSKYTVFDYNKIEYTDQDENYFYGAVSMGGAMDGIIHRTGDLFEESCMIISVDPPVTVAYETFNSVDFTPYESDFTNEEDIAITLIDQPLRAKYACEIVLSDGMENESQLSIYPNPAANNITVTVSDDLMNATYVVMDLSGKQIIVDKVNATQMEIDLSGLTHGQYILAIQGENQLITEKITVIK